MKKKKEAIEDLPKGVRKRGKGYTYRYSVPIIKPDGKPGRKQKETPAYDTPDEAYRAGVIIEAKLIDGTYIDEDNILFIDWAVKGLEIYAAEKKLKKSTIETKQANLSYAKVYFAGKRLKAITPVMYQEYLKMLRDEKKLGASALSGSHSAMRILFKLAVRLGIISKDPTASAVKPVIKVTFEELELGEEPLPEYLEKEQLALLLKVAKLQAAEETDLRKAFAARQHFRIIFLLAHSGLRIGEMCGLEQIRINLKDRRIRIISNLYLSGGITNYELETPKNEASIRTVDFSKSVGAVIENQISDLKTFKLLIGEKFYTNRQFLFVSTKRFPGYPLDPATFAADLHDSLERAQLPTSITPHKLRHTFTSLSAEAGAALEDIQQQLGHKTDEVTTRIYLHVTEGRRKANVDKLDSLMKNLLNGL